MRFDFCFHSPLVKINCPQYLGVVGKFTTPSLPALFAPDLSRILDARFKSGGTARGQKPTAVIETPESRPVGYNVTLPPANFLRVMRKNFSSITADSFYQQPLGSVDKFGK